MFIESNKNISTHHGLSKYVKIFERLYLIIRLLAILSKMCTDLGILRYFFLCANAIIITFKNNMCSNVILDKLAKLCAYLSFHFSCLFFMSRC